MIELSVCIPTLDATSEYARECLDSIRETVKVAHEVVIVDNGGCPQGYTAPMNAALAAARGEYLVACNDDVQFLDGWWPPLRQALDDGAKVSFPLTIEGFMRNDFAAWCFALTAGTRDELEVLPGEFLDPALFVWFSDTDLLNRLRRVGHPPVMVQESRIRHRLGQSMDSEGTRAQIARDADTFRARRR